MAVAAGEASGAAGVSKEQEYWRKLIEDLTGKFTLGYIADEIGVSARQVTNIRNGDRPKGWVALRLYLFHMKHGTQVLALGEVSAGTEVPCIPAPET